MEKIIAFIADTLKVSFVIGCVGSWVVYLASILASKKKTGKWGFSLLVAVIYICIGGIVGYFVGTVVPITNPNRDLIIGLSGAGSFPIYLFLEKYGYELMNKIAEKLTNKI